MSRKERVILCPDCSGNGRKYERTSGYDSEWIKCRRCNKSGRIVQVTTTTEKPYKK